MMLTLDSWSPTRLHGWVWRSYEGATENRGAIENGPVWLLVDLPNFTVCGFSSLLCEISTRVFFFRFFRGYTLKNNLVHHLGGDIRNKYAAEILYEWFGWSKWWWMVCQTGSNHIFLRTAFSGRYLIICIPMIETVAAQAAEGFSLQGQDRTFCC